MLKWLLKNFWLKVVAFAMALMIWVHVATNKTYNYELKLPVTEVVLKNGLTLAKEPPDSLQVAVSASGKQLLRRKWRDRGLRINANQYQAGRFNMTISSLNTALAQQTSEVSLDEVIAPTVIRLEIDHEDSTEVPVEADIDAASGDGFAIGHQLRVEPEKVILTGPRSNLDEVKAVKTRHKQLESLRNTVTVRLPLVPPEGYGFGVHPDSVAVTIPVLPVKTRVFEDIPIALLNAPPGPVRIQPDRVTVEITGPPEEVEALAVNAVVATADFRQLDPDGRVAIKVEFPPGFKLKALSIDSVRVAVNNNVDPRD